MSQEKLIRLICNDFYIIYAFEFTCVWLLVSVALVVAASVSCVLQIVIDLQKRQILQHSRYYAYKAR